MKLSFIIPAYNEEKYIGQCLDSIFRELKNTSYDTEIIVVNNASTDKTKEIAQKYPGVKIVDEPAKGLVRARRTGFLAATGDLIANVDSDTMLTPGWIERVFREFEKNKKLVALSGPFIYYDLSKGIDFMVRKVFYPIGFVIYLVNHFIFRRGGMLQGGNFVVRRDALTKIGGYNTDIDFYGEDTDIANRIGKVGTVKFTFKLPIYSSGRRLAGEGAFTMGLRYGMNYLWMIFFKRPYTKTSIIVRPETEGGKLIYKPVNRKREWAAASFLILATFIVLAGLGYLGYYLVQSGVVSAINAARVRMETRVQNKINDISTQIKNTIETTTNELKK